MIILKAISGFGLTALFFLSITFGMSYYTLQYIKVAAMIDLKTRGIEVREKGEWLNFSNSNIWCKRAKEYSEHAEICQEGKPR